MFRKFLPVLVLLAVAPAAVALPSTDPKFRAAVPLPNGSTVVITRDPFNPYAWYFSPAALRVAKDGNGVPKFRWVEYVLGGKQHAILQFAVRGDLEPADFKLCQEAAVKWFNLQNQAGVIVPKPEQIQLSPVGPIRSAALRSIVVRNKLIEIVGETTDTPVPAPPPAPKTALPKPADPKPEAKDGEQAAPEAGKTFAPETAKGPTVATPGTLPAVTELTQESWVQYEISGPGVQVIRELLKGNGKGGILLMYAGFYQAYTPEVSVEVKMKVKAVAKFFREKKVETSGWSILGLFGSSETKVHDFIEKHGELKEAITITRIGGGQLDAAAYAAIETRLFNWVTKNVFDPKSAAVATAMGTTVVDPATGKLLNVGPIAGAIFGVPSLAGMEISLGYQSSASYLNVRAEETLDVESTATWKGFDIIDAPVVLYGAVSVDKKHHDLFRDPIELKPVPTLFVNLPGASNNLLNLYAGSKLTIAGRDVQLGFDPKERVWTPNPGAINVDGERNGGRAYFDTAKARDAATVTWSLPNPNSGDNGDLVGLANFEVTARQKDGVAAFGSDSFPFRPVLVDAAPLVEFLNRDGATGVKLRAVIACELSADDKKKQTADIWKGPQTVGFGVLPVAEQKGGAIVPRPHAERYVVGAVTGLTVQVNGTYRDAFLGERPFSDCAVDPKWQAAKLAGLQARRTEKGVLTDPAPATGLVSVGPDALGLRRYGLSFNLLAVAKAVPKLCKVELTGAGGKAATRTLMYAAGAGWKDLATNAAVPDGVVWLATTVTPTGVTVTVTDQADNVKTTTIPAPAVRAWAETQGTLVLESK